MTPETLDLHIHNLLEGLINDVDFEALQMELRLNPEAREIYLEHIFLQNTLEIHAQGEDQMVLSSETPLISPLPAPSISKSQKKIKREVKNKRTPTKKNAPRLLNQVPPPNSVQKQHQKEAFPPLSGLVTWASAALVAVSATVFFAISYLENAGWGHDIEFATIQISPGTTIELYSNGKHTPGDLIIPNTIQDVSPGDRIKVNKGFVQIDFADGVRGIIEAPADFTFNGEKDISLPSGKAWFNVPKEGQGFTVTTTQTKNVDLGTQFGIFAHEKRDDQLTVFKGEVAISSLQKPNIRQTIGAGTTLACDEKGSLYADSSPSVFLAKLPTNPPHLHWSFDKIDENQQLKPTGALANTKYIDSKIISKSPTFIDGKHNKAVSLEKKGELIRTSWKGIESSANRTVMLWLKIPEDFNPRIIPMPPIVAWGTPSSSANSHWQLKLHQRNGYFSPSVSLGASQYHGLTDIPLEEWVHVAVVQRGRSDNPFQLYINGEMHPIQPSTASLNRPPIRTVITGENSHPLQIGGIEFKNRRQTIPCALDDLYIFGDAISGKTIKHWMEHQSPPPSSDQIAK